MWSFKLHIQQIQYECYCRLQIWIYAWIEYIVNVSKMVMLKRCVSECMVYLTSTYFLNVPFLYFIVYLLQTKHNIKINDICFIYFNFVLIKIFLLWKCKLHSSTLTNMSRKIQSIHLIWQYIYVTRNNNIILFKLAILFL